VKTGRTPTSLPAGLALPVPAAEIDAFIAGNDVAGLIVPQDGWGALEC
jgi:hypothetical protein